MCGMQRTTVSPSSSMHEPQHAVRGGVLRTDVDEHVLGGEIIARTAGRAERHANVPAGGVDARRAQRKFDGPGAHATSPRSPRVSRSRMSTLSSRYDEAMESSSRE